MGRHRFPPPPTALVSAAVLLAVAWAASPSLARAGTPEVRCETPRQAVLTWLSHLDPGDPGPLAATQCFDWSRTRLTPAERLERARRLRRVLNARGDVVPVHDLPDTHTVEQGRTVPFFPARYPELYVTRVGDRWLVSAETVAAIPRLYAATFALDVDAWVESAPPWLRAPLVFGVAPWQLLGLALVLAVAWLLQLALSRVVAGWGGRALERAGFRSSPVAVAKAAIPFGMLAFAALVDTSFPMLGFGVGLNRVVSVAARVLIGASVVLVLYRVVDVVAEVFARRAALTPSRFDDQLVPLLRKTSKVVLVVLGAILVLQNLDVDVGSLLAGVSLGGLAFSLAARDTVANLFGSVSIFLDKPFQVGDWVVVDGVEGTVEEVGMRSTRIRTFYDSLVSVPNSRAADANVDNYGARRHRRTYITVRVTYDTTPEQLEALTDGVRAILAAHPRVRKDKYEVHFSGFGESGLDVMVYFFFTVASWSEELEGRHEVFLEIVRLAHAIGVSFAFPTRTLHLASAATPEPRVPHEVPASEALASTVLAFGPGGRLSRPHGPRLTHGFFAGRQAAGDSDDSAAR